MLHRWFEKVTAGCARFTGRPAMFALCLLLAGVGIGAYFSNNDHFLNGANLSISIVTLLLLPILQATQNRDGAALQAKLDELISANRRARNEMIGIERDSEDKIERERPDRATTRNQGNSE
ncbi:low affinity iron permease family protein [Sphingomonas jaspsi]|uniref:low affinity iron permease family protein n=1 Tax=Sphingomonas jaspsi TaxID=392409 RepID=UPI000A074CAE|nr:low affinity iron permease family protein [Sphingomonas jaspsi]